MLRARTVFWVALVAALWPAAALAEDLEQMVDEDEAAIMKEAGAAEDSDQGDRAEEPTPVPPAEASSGPEAPAVNPEDVQPGAREFPEEVEAGGSAKQVPEETGEVADPDEVTVDEGVDVDDATIHERGLQPITIDPTVEDAPEEGVGGDYGD